MGLRDSIRIIVTGDAKGAEKMLKGVSKDAEKAGGGFKSFAKGAAIGFGAAATAAIAFGVDAVKTFATEQAAHVKLLTAMKQAGQTWGQYGAQVDAVAKSSENLGYDSADTQSALAQGEMATKSMSKSMQLLAIAQNMTAATGKPLSDSMLAIIKGSEGSTRALKQMGIDIAVPAGGAEKTKKALIALAAAKQKLDQVQSSTGASSDAAKTANAQALGKAMQNLDFLEQRLHAKRQLSVSDQQSLVRAQEAVAAARTRGVRPTLALQNAEAAVAKAQQNFTDVSSAGPQIVAAAQKAYAGQAAAHSKTLEGQVEAMKAKWTDLKAKIGAAIVPKLTEAMNWFTNTFLPGFSRGWKIISGYLDGFDAGVMQIWHDAQNAFDAVTSLLGLNSHAHSDTAKIESANDVKMGWKSGTTHALNALNAADVSAENNTMLTAKGKQDVLAMDAAKRKWILASQPKGATQPPTSVTHIHLGPGVNPAQVRQAQDRQNKRNGIANRGTRPYDATGP